MRLLALRYPGTFQGGVGEFIPFDDGDGMPRAGHCRRGEQAGQAGPDHHDMQRIGPICPSGTPRSARADSD
jgi:hypothetical protein